MTDKVAPERIYTTEQSIVAIKQAVADNDDVLLASILFTRQLWAYDQGQKERSDQLLTIFNNWIAAWRRQIKKDTKKAQGVKELPEIREQRLATRRYMFSLVDLVKQQIMTSTLNVSYVSKLYQGDTDDADRKTNGSIETGEPDGQGEVPGSNANSSNSVSK